ncbi:unnamed protein product [Camellia sinensis]
MVTKCVYSYFHLLVLNSWQNKDRSNSVSKPFLLQQNFSTPKTSLAKVALLKHTRLIIISSKHKAEAEAQQGQGGKLNDKREIAVKKPLLISEKGTELVLNEMKLLLGSAHHRNIVKFLGICSHREEMLLVFEFARNSSLDYLLFNSETGRSDALEWKRTYDIIVGVAWGLHYLHERSHSVIIHCDIKPANILIDENWVIKMLILARPASSLKIKRMLILVKLPVPLGIWIPSKLWRRLSKGRHIQLLGSGFGVDSQKNWLFHDRSSNGQDLRDRANELYKEGRVSEFMDRKMTPLAILDQVQSCVHIGNHSSSSTLVEELMRDGSSSASSTARNSG